MASQLTKIVANFLTQITTNISIGGTTTALATNIDKDGNTIPNGKYFLTINQGTVDEQHIYCDLSGLNITNVFGVSHQGIVTAGFLKEGRINDEVKLTDFAVIIRIVELLSGTIALDGGTPIKYDAAPALTNDRQIPDRGYVNAQDALRVLLAGVNVISANNTFTGQNVFNQSPTVPTAINGTDAVNLTQVLGIAFGSVTLYPGFQTSDIRFDNLGRIESVHDRLRAKTYFFRYRVESPYVPFLLTTDDEYWYLDYSTDGLLIATKKN